MCDKRWSGSVVNTAPMTTNAERMLRSAAMFRTRRAVYNAMRPTTSDSGRLKPVFFLSVITYIFSRLVPNILDTLDLSTYFMDVELYFIS